jgi:hypothetical protein
VWRVLFLVNLINDSWGVSQEVTPYVSAAELVKKFESGTRKMSINNNRSLSVVSITSHFCHYIVIAHAQLHFTVYIYYNWNTESRKQH